MPVNKDIVAKSIEFYGKDKEQTVCMEECAELIQAISKGLRGKLDLANLIEEMADVVVCIEILQQIYDITDMQLQRMVTKKQLRIKLRMLIEDYE